MSQYRADRTTAILGQEAIAGRYGLGRVTNLDNPSKEIGVTPYVIGHQMLFAPHNIELVPIRGHQ